MTLSRVLQLTSRHKVQMFEGRIQHTSLRPRNVLYRTSFARSVLRRVVKTLHRKHRSSRIRPLTFTRYTRARSTPADIRLPLAYISQPPHIRARSNCTNCLLPPPSSFLRFDRLYRKQGKSPLSVMFSRSPSEK
jgi:hypothetical protein